MNFLSIDVGTTCCKCQLFSESGEILAYKSEEYPLKILQDETYVDIEGIWGQVSALILFAAQIGEVNSICISSFGESFVLLDSEDNALFLPMLYTDPRGEVEAAEILKIFGAETLFSRVGSLSQSLFSISKLLWIKKHFPEIYLRTDKLLLIGDFLGYMLTGERVIDYGLAARTGVFNVEEKEFDRTILGTLGVREKIFSVAKPTGSIVGTVQKSLLEQLGLKENCTLVLGSHDQICAAIGAGAVRAGDAVDGMGTVECITAVFGKRTENANIRINNKSTGADAKSNTMLMLPCAETEVKSMAMCGYTRVPYMADGLYCTYMFNYSSGSLINWYKNKILHGYKELESSFFDYIEKGMTEEPTGILTLPYFAGAATPYQNINAKGAVLNLTTETSDSDFYKSILEGTAMEMRLNAEEAQKHGVRIERVIAIGGGANSEKWLALKADIQNIPIKTLRSSEGGLCGCAMLQSVAMKKVKNLIEAAVIFVVYDKEYLPDQERHNAYENQYAKYKKLYQVIKEFY